MIKEVRFMSEVVQKISLFASAPEAPSRRSHSRLVIVCISCEHYKLPKHITPKPGLAMRIILVETFLKKSFQIDYIFIHRVRHTDEIRAPYNV